MFPFRHHARHCRPAFGPPGGPGRLHHQWGPHEGWGGKHFERHFNRHFGGHGPHRGERWFGRGDLKYVILDLVKEEPRHGYDVIRAIEERFGGFYSPSPGSVYPILQLLEDQGYLQSSQQDGKRVYAITDEGRAFLEERADVVEGLHERMGAKWGGQVTPEVRQLVGELWGLGQVVVRHGTHGGLADPDKVRRLREVVARARSEVEAIFGNQPPSGGVTV